MKDLRPYGDGFYFRYVDADIRDTCIKTLLASVRGARLQLEAERLGLCQEACPAESAMP